MAEQIEDIREKIDRIDDNILQLLIKRVNLAKIIGNIKNKTSGSIYRPAREQDIIRRLVNQDTDLLNKETISNVFLEIFSVTRNIQSQDKIGYLGPQGSFAHEAAKQHFGKSTAYIPIKNIQAIFKSVKSRHIKFGVLPIENSLEGMVRESIRSLYFTEIKIVAEIIMPINMVFASKQEDISKIEKIYSKDIALTQCRNFFRNFFIEEVPKIPVSSTSNAAKSCLKEPNAAAVCSEISAKLLNLPILFKNIQDTDKNQTRFLVISQEDFINEKTNQDKSTILVTLPDTQKAGALSTFLDCFKTHYINISKIESYIDRDANNFSYWFLIDFEKHFEDESFQKIYSLYKEYIKFRGSYTKVI